MEVVITHTEVEALLLECNLIKRFMPRYNVLLRDDKSFPYIHLTGNGDFPQLTKHRGATGDAGDYFGPFASAGAVNRTLIALQKAFLLRSCTDSYFATRYAALPALSDQALQRALYRPHRQRGLRQADRRSARFSERPHAGRAEPLSPRIMTDKSEALDFEGAALIRDRIRALTQVQGRQDINVQGLGDADVIAAHQAGPHACVQVFFFRGGQNWGNRAYFPAHTQDTSMADMLAAFIGQFYANRVAPPCVFVNEMPSEAALIAEALIVARRAQGRAHRAAARRQAQAGRARADQRPRGAGPPPRRRLGPGEAVAGRRRRLRPRRAAASASRFMTTATSRAPMPSAR